MSYHVIASSSAHAEWPTPRWLFDELAAEFGPFDLDPCATAENHKAPAYFTAAQDGLSLPWFGRVWMNPPYGRTDAYGRTIGDWLVKAHDEVEIGNAHLVVCLVPANVETRWWRNATANASLVRILPGRVKFTKNQTAPFASAVIVFGKLEGRHGTEHKRCENCGRVFWPAQENRKTCSNTCKVAHWRKRP